MPAPTLRQLVAALVDDGIEILDGADAKDVWLSAHVEGPEPRLSRGFLARYDERTGELAMRTELNPQAGSPQEAPHGLHHAMLCANRVLYGAALATEDGVLYYKPPRRVLAEPHDYRRLLALMLTEASMLDLALQRIVVGGQRPLPAIEMVREHGEHLDFLRSTQPPQPE